MFLLKKKANSLSKSIANSEDAVMLTILKILHDSPGSSITDISNTAGINTSVLFNMMDLFCLEELTISMPSENRLNSPYYLTNFGEKVYSFSNISLS